MSHKGAKKNGLVLLFSYKSSVTNPSRGTITESGSRGVTIACDAIEFVQERLSLVT